MINGLNIKLENKQKRDNYHFSLARRKSADFILTKESPINNRKFFIFLILFSINLLLILSLTSALDYRNLKFQVNKDGSIELSGFTESSKETGEDISLILFNNRNIGFSSYTGVEKELLKHIDSIRNFMSSKGYEGEIKFDENGNTIITYANGQEFAKIPNGYKSDFKDEKIIIKRESSLTLIGPRTFSLTKHKIGNIEISPATTPFSGISEYVYSENSGLEEIEVKGSSTVKIGGKLYNNIKDAVFRVNNGEIEYARFSSINGGLYSFGFNGFTYNFRVSKGGLVVFDLKGKKTLGRES